MSKTSQSLQEELFGDVIQLPLGTAKFKALTKKLHNPETHSTYNKYC